MKPDTRSMEEIWCDGYYEELRARKANSLIVVMAHASAQEIFDRHLPLWEKYHTRIIVASPIDAPVMTRHMQIGCSLASHSRELGLCRVKILFWYLAHRYKGFSRYFIFEYDSFFTGPKLPETNHGLTGNLNVSFDKEFTSLIYPVPPWVIDGFSLVKMQKAMEDSNGILYEEGFMDRYLAEICDYANVQMSDYSPAGFYSGTITPSDYPAITEAKNHGAFAWHGIKDKETLDFILQC